MMFAISLAVLALLAAFAYVFISAFDFYIKSETDELNRVISSMEQMGSAEAAAAKTKGAAA
jgi:hypothetical protein